MAIMNRYARVFLVILFFFFDKFFFVHANTDSYPLIMKDMGTMRALCQHLPTLSTTSHYRNTTHPNPCFWRNLQVICSYSSASKSFSRVVGLHLDSTHPQVTHPQPPSSLTSSVALMPFSSSTSPTIPSPRSQHPPSPIAVDYPDCWRNSILSIIH